MTEAAGRDYLSSRVPLFFLPDFSETSVVFFVPLLLAATCFFPVVLLATAFLELDFAATAFLEVDFALGRFAELERDRDGRPLTTSDWPGKIIARRRPLPFMRVATVVW